MPRPNPQGIPIPPEAQKPPEGILRPLRAYRPNRHEPPKTEQTPNRVFELYESHDSIFVRLGAHEPLRLSAHQQTKNTGNDSLSRSFLA